MDPAEKLEKECAVDYEVENSHPAVITIYRTFVHPELRGRGIAEALLKSVSEYVKQNGFRIRPTCSYAVTFYKRRAYASLLADDVDLESGGSCRLPQK